MAMGIDSELKSIDTKEEERWQGEEKRRRGERMKLMYMNMSSRTHQQDINITKPRRVQLQLRLWCEDDGRHTRRVKYYQVWRWGEILSHTSLPLMFYVTLTSTSCVWWVMGVNEPRACTYALPLLQSPTHRNNSNSSISMHLLCMGMVLILISLPVLFCFCALKLCLRWCNQIRKSVRCCLN